MTNTSEIYLTTTLLQKHDKKELFFTKWEAKAYDIYTNGSKQMFDDVKILYFLNFTALKKKCRVAVS